MSNSSGLRALSLVVQDASLKYETENNLSEAENYMQLWRQNGEKIDIKASLKIYLIMELFLKRIVLMANTSTIFRFA
ncbi:potassium:proton antiporter [Klebsiella pneumoniae]|uniref:potassium:proton antiporter n=1 Tax=Klebsiella pneumoniae TaxID=573 RepID=UPI000D594FBB|nr:potassium:proton antiporter [Klebsiella pneumoniae]